MKAVVISGGQPVSDSVAHYYLKDADIIICADKGAEYALHYKVAPDIIVGDMDSIDDSKLSFFSNSIVETSPKEKDYTDTHIAVMRALEKGADRITVICATGLRSDHAIANIRLLLHIDKNGAKGIIADDQNTIFLCTGETIFNNKKGTTVSLISLSENTEGINTEGFKYPLNDCNADLAWTTGISNEIISDFARISISKGRLLVFEINSNL